MNPIAYFLLVLVQSNLLLALSMYLPQEYVIPEPKFEVFSPGGFTVSVPHEDGMTLFAFHANINVPMNGLQAGQFSKDVLKNRKDKWVFEDRSTKLERGDVIYFWMLVIKNNLGYRYDDGRFVVQDIVQKQVPDRSHASSARPTTQSNPNEITQTLPYSPMCEIALNLSSAVAELKSDVKVLQEENNVLKDILAKDRTSSRMLRFGGVLPPFDDALYTVQIILQEKLGIRIRVVNATKESDNSISFEVDSLDDKIRVIKTAREKLAKAKSKIVLTY